MNSDNPTRIRRAQSCATDAREFHAAVAQPDTALVIFFCAASPVVVMIDGTNYVRSIQKANPDGSLTFFCAIENGLVLWVAKGVDLLGISRSSLKDRVGELLLRNTPIGFNTYGEQFQGVHVNQTLVGIAIGVDATETDDD